MTTGARLQFLHSALDRAKIRLDLCTGSCDWHGAREAAEEAAVVDDEIKALRLAEADTAPRNIVGRVQVDG